MTSSCLVEEKCFQNGDCATPKICNADGRCVYECTKDVHCGPGFVCLDHQCLIDLPDSDDDSIEPITCPDDMVSIENVYCMDRHEASRPDATASSEGIDESIATSREGVLPWRVIANVFAEKACEAAGKSLCTPAQWAYACHGPENSEYVYGNEYDTATCNGISSFGIGNFHLAPTGSFPDCVNAFGAFDLSGNVWEHVLGGDSTQVRGGAFNCSIPAEMHKCDYIPQTWAPSALGFRCCLAEDSTGDDGE